MINHLNDLTIVSITFNNDGIYRTIDSVQPLLQSGAKMIIQNGGTPLKHTNKEIIVNDKEDKGIYDALNKGINSVRTKYFMLLHAGDSFIGTAQELMHILKDLEYSSNSLSLNSQYIGRRLHSSVLWRKWMLHLGVQPPHLPCIYKSAIYKAKKYSLEIPIIADFHFFSFQVEWEGVIWHNKLLVKMEEGGVTSGGLISFLTVSSSYLKTYGIKKGLIMALFRIPFKLLQALI